MIMMVLDAIQAEYANQRFEWLSMKAGCRKTTEELPDEFITFSEFMFQLMLTEFKDPAGSWNEIFAWLFSEVTEDE
jgi:hypothetical protein